MFKKAIEAKALQRLSGADRKKLKRTVKDKFPQASDADIDVILPPKAEITVSKYPNRVHVYAVEGDFPVIFDVDGRGTEMYPTVYALWKLPNLLPAFLLKGGEVSRFVIGGADLMFPGISIPAEGLPSFSAGEPWAVKVPGNPAPIAVGCTTMSSSEAVKAGLRGKALRITHYYRDSLWESAEGHHVPNAGFFEDVVLEDPALCVSQTPELQEDNCSASNDLHSNGGSNGGVQISKIQDAPTELDANASVQTDNKGEIPQELSADMSRLKMVDNVKSEDNDAEQRALTTEDMDALLDKCLLQALYTSVKDKDLPMPGSTLWSNHVLPCRPSGVTLDVKKSSHKKLSKWLQSKSSAGLISAKEDKHKKEVVLLAVNRGHQHYMSFRPEKRLQAANSSNDSAPVEGRQTKDTKLQLEIVEIFKSSTHLNPIFLSVGADPGIFYSATEATDVVFKYVESQNLVKPTDKAVVVLDAILCDALYKGTVKKGSSYPTEIHKKDLGSTFLSRMQVHHRVARGDVSALQKGPVKVVQIMTERRQGNKKVTRVSGLESFLIDAEALATELQKKFACSTTVAELLGKKGQHEVLVQGGVIEDLARLLVEQYGIPKRYIEVLDKTRK